MRPEGSTLGVQESCYSVSKIPGQARNDRADSKVNQQKKAFWYFSAVKSTENRYEIKKEAELSLRSWNKFRMTETLDCFVPRNDET